MGVEKTHEIVFFSYIHHWRVILLRRDIGFASYIALRTVEKGEYIITEFEEFNINACASKQYHYLRKQIDEFIA